MRLIGSANPLPLPTRHDIGTSFSVLELRDYYIPNDKDIILRSVAVAVLLSFTYSNIDCCDDHHSACTQKKQ